MKPAISPQLAWNRAHPAAMQAHQAVRQAKRRGELEPQPCRICGAPAEAHHPDYDKPLRVEWLCRWHHRRLHNFGPGDLIAGIGP